MSKHYEAIMVEEATREKFNKLKVAKMTNTELLEALMHKVTVTVDKVN